MKSHSTLSVRSSILLMAIPVVLVLTGWESKNHRTIAVSSPYPTSAPSGTFAWPSWAKGNPQPGVDHAAAYACWDDHVVFVIWTDFDTSSGGTSGPTTEGVYRATLTSESGTQVECECQTTDGTSGTLDIRVDTKQIGDESYDLEQGNVFLISTRSGVLKVTQLSPDVFDESIDNAKDDVELRLRELTKSDAKVREFLGLSSAETLPNPKP